MMKEYTHLSLSRYFQTMHRNAQRLLSLINELMDFGKSWKSDPSGFVYSRGA